MLNINKKSKPILMSILLSLFASQVFSIEEKKLSFIQRHNVLTSCALGLTSTLLYFIYQSYKQPENGSDIKNGSDTKKSNIKKSCIIGVCTGLCSGLLIAATSGQQATSSSQKKQPENLPAPEETLEAIMKYAVDYAKPMTVPTKDDLSMLNFSILHDSLCHNLAQTTSSPLSSADAKLIMKKIKSIIDKKVNDSINDRSVGAFIGNALGDAIGAPLEFIEANHEDPKPKLENVLKNSQLSYMNAFNKFKTKPGQWTDDFSMALCLADSLITNPTGYNGSDCRTRYCNWWQGGYNNAFRFDEKRENRHSIGLGGNISKSIDAIVKNHAGKDASVVPALFDTTGNDAGNGSIMRNSPIAIRFLSDMETALKASIEQSLGTHPGGDAAVCCAFMTYITIKAINKDEKDTNISAFLDKTIQLFLNEFPTYLEEIKISSINQEDLKTSFITLSRLLNSASPSQKEALWNWKAHTLPIKETLNARGSKYNGYPVNAGYLGSYCMDGIAMALWALNTSTSFETAIIRCVNLLGDADSTGAICGQIAGAFYGYTSMKKEPITGCAINNMSKWDPYNEIILRGLMLCSLSKKTTK